MVAEQQAQVTNEQRPGPVGLGRITVSGYKSILDPISIRIAPLTVLAGANSSGKSSIMQPLLLLKQTLEAPFDPGALLLRGPNVKFSSADQMFSRLSARRRAKRLSVAISNLDGTGLRTDIVRNSSGDLEILETEWRLSADKDSAVIASLDTSSESYSDMFEPFIDELTKLLPMKSRPNLDWSVDRRRCFLELSLILEHGRISSPIRMTGSVDSTEFSISSLIHLPGLRGNPERTYPVTAVGSIFSGVFQTYTASIIAHWQNQQSSAALADMNVHMRQLALADSILARRINDTEVDLQISRSPSTRSTRDNDTVSIADVGLGVSQTLPVVVALLVAEPGRAVYIEQPEIHLHPNAQFRMADILIEAAHRGVRVIVETHSSITLLGIQAAVAEGRIPGEDIALHWFSRDKVGQTHVQSVEMDESGAFGDWPEDFSDVYLHAQGRYLDAVEKRHLTN